MNIENFTNIKLVTAEQIRTLRHKMLRQGKDFATTAYDKDNKQDTFHLGAFKEDKIISCATFYPENTRKTKSNKAYRLRGMATVSDYFRKGFGAKIMHQAYKILNSRNCDLLWCNARLVALKFYKSVGMCEIGDIFNISDIGAHYYMYKRLNK